MHDLVQPNIQQIVNLVFCFSIIFTSGCLHCRTFSDDGTLVDRVVWDTWHTHIRSSETLGKIFQLEPEYPGSSPAGPPGSAVRGILPFLPSDIKAIPHSLMKTAEKLGPIFAFYTGSRWMIFPHIAKAKLIGGEGKRNRCANANIWMQIMHAKGQRKCKFECKCWMQILCSTKRETLHAIFLRYNTLLNITVI